MPRRRVVLATGGSLGDLHPFLAVGKALRALGLEAEIATSADFRDKVLAEGLGFHEIGIDLTALESGLGMDRDAITRAVMRSNRFLFEKIILPGVPDATRRMIAASQGAGAIVGHSFALGARIAAEGLGLLYTPVALQPMTVLSAYDPPVLPMTPWLRPVGEDGRGLTLNRLTLKASRLATSGWTNRLNAARRALDHGPAPGDMVFDALDHAPLALGLYSPLLGPPQPDAPATFKVVGYAAYDSEAGGPPVLSAELSAFLKAGPPPVVFTLGSAAVYVAGDFYRRGLEAARRLGRRAVLLVGPEGDLGVADGPDALTVRYAPYSLLFPHAAAIVHQGGVGTTQQALRSGRPQLIIPHLGDQPDNGARIARLGCGRTLNRNAYGRRIDTDLRAVLDDDAMAAHATALGDVARNEDGAAEAARLIVSLMREPAS